MLAGQVVTVQLLRFHVRVGPAIICEMEVLLQASPTARKENMAAMYAPSSSDMWQLNILALLFTDREQTAEGDDANYLQRPALTASDANTGTLWSKPPVNDLIERK